MRWTQDGSRKKNSSFDFDDDYSTGLPEKLKKSAGAVWNMAQPFLMARGKIRPIDYIGFAAGFFRGGTDLFNVWFDPPEVDLAAAFQESEGWRIAPYFAARYAFSDVDFRAEELLSPRLFETSRWGLKNKTKQAAWTTTIMGIQIGWVGSENCPMPTQIYTKASPDEVRNLAADRMWEIAGDERCLRIKGERMLPVHIPPNLIETEFLRSVERRTRIFSEGNVPRAVILDGEPGTGKSVASLYIARKMNAKAAVFSAENYQHFVASPNSSEGMVSGSVMGEMLRPEVLIINDIDRLDTDDQLSLLDNLDTAKSYAKIIFVTTNNYRKLIEPIRRPGRLDDLIHVPGLTNEEVRQVAPDLPLAIVQRVHNWPVAYVADIQRRIDILGVEDALKELHLLETRLSEVRADMKNERN